MPPVKRSHQVASWGVMLVLLITIAVCFVSHSLVPLWGVVAIGATVGVAMQSRQKTTFWDGGE